MYSLEKWGGRFKSTRASTVRKKWQACAYTGCILRLRPGGLSDVIRRNVLMVGEIVACNSCRHWAGCCCCCRFRRPRCGRDASGLLAVISQRRMLSIAGESHLSLSSLSSRTKRRSPAPSPRIFSIVDARAAAAAAAAATCWPAVDLAILGWFWSSVTNAICRFGLPHFKAYLQTVCQGFELVML